MNDPIQTLPAVVRRATERHRGRPAVIDGDAVLDYADLAGRCEAVGRALIAAGVGFGDRVAVWMPNRIEWILAACGAHMAGAVLVPINTRMKGAEAADILERISHPTADAVAVERNLRGWLKWYRLATADDDCGYLNAIGWDDAEALASTTMGLLAAIRSGGAS